jgi:hypothetical protein
MRAKAQSHAPNEGSQRFKSAPLRQAVSDVRFLPKNSERPAQWGPRPVVGHRRKL